MASDSGNEKQRAHELIEILSASQISALLGFVRAMFDPVACCIAAAPVDDEPESEQETQAVAESKDWFERRGGQGISHEEVLSDFGFPKQKEE